MICDKFCKLIVDLYIKVDPFMKKDNNPDKEASNGSEDSRPIKE